jgi:lipopolysaccharide export system permease protein
LISLILPLALFFAVAFSINRLHSESETSVLYAAGVSNWQIARPILRLAVLAALFHLAVTTLIQPLSFREYRETLYSIRADVASSLVQEGDFNQAANGLTIFAGERLGGGQIRHLFIQDSRNPDRPRTYSAARGSIATIDGKPAILMRDAQVQEPKSDGSINVVFFEEYLLQLDDFFDSEEQLLLKSSDRFLGELFRPDVTNFFDQRNVDDFLAEGHQRLAGPLMNIALALLALAGLLTGEFSRRGYGQRLAVTAALALVVRLAALAVQQEAADDPDLNWAQYALPVSVAVICALLLMRRGRIGSRRMVIQMSEPSRPALQTGGS